MRRSSILCAVVLSVWSLAAMVPASAAAPSRYIIESASMSDARAAVTQAGARIVLELPGWNAVAAMLTEASRSQLASDGRVRGMELDPERFPMSQTTPYGISMVQADQLHSLNPAGIKVCIIDSGLAIFHEDIPSGVTGSADRGAGIWSEDGLGHGSHVAGTVAAVDNSVGVVGASPGVALHIVRVFDDYGTWAYGSTLILALDECRAAGAKVVNMSLGGGGRSNLERRAFAQALLDGILPIAAAGNDGTSRTFYPAGYDSVVSVAALDANKIVAGFSQKNHDVELAGPGVGVLSTVPWLETNTLTVGSSTFNGTWLEEAARTTGTSGALVDGGLCTAPGSWSGSVVLCQRGTITFADKVANVAAGGGVAAVVYNNAPGGFHGTLLTPGTIPGIGISMEDGAAALTHLGETGSVVSLRTEPASGYEEFDGTSMATPHVSGVAALVWSFNPSWTATQIRDALTSTALDLGTPRRDRSYGFGLVQAKAALCSLDPSNAVC
jgi:subtilisin family serine protease